jgi:CCR4-NOT transcription complex subunit 1
MVEGIVCLFLESNSFYLSLDAFLSGMILIHCLLLTEAATEFAIALVQTLVTQESGVFISELFNVVDVLSKVRTSQNLGKKRGRKKKDPLACSKEIKCFFFSCFQIASRPGSPESLQQLIEIVRSNNAPIKDEKARQSRDKKVI